MPPPPFDLTLPFLGLNCTLKPGPWDHANARDRIAFDLGENLGDRRRTGIERRSCPTKVGADAILSIEAPNESNPQGEKHGNPGWADQLRAFTYQIIDEWPIAKKPDDGRGFLFGLSIDCRAHQISEKPNDPERFPCC